MNVLVLTSEFAPATGGIGTYAREIAAAATKLGARVLLVAPDYFEPGGLAGDRDLSFEVRRFSGGQHSMRDLPAKVQIARTAVASGRYDVIHAADWPFFVPMALARGRTDARRLMTVHGTEINEMQTVAKRLAIGVTGVFGERAEVVANSAFTRDLFLARFPAPACRVRAVPLGVSEFWFGARADRATARAALGIDGDAIVMVTVARLTRRKGHLTTLSALAHVPDRLRRRMIWLVIGPDGEADYVRELKHAAAGSSCDVRFLGRRPDDEIRDIYGASDVFCLTGVHDPSGRIEGFGLVYLEAAAGGLPSVATAIGGVPDAVIGNRTGLLVEPSDNTIADAITRLADDKAMRLAIGQGALAHARSLSWERCAASTYGLAVTEAPLVPEATGPAVELRRRRRRAF